MTGRSSKSLLQRFELGYQARGNLVAELGEECLGVGNVGFECFGVHFRQLGEVFGGDKFPKLSNLDLPSDSFDEDDFSLVLV